MGAIEDRLRGLKTFVVKIYVGKEKYLVPVREEEDSRRALVLAHNLCTLKKSVH